MNDLYKLETAKFVHQFSDKSLAAAFENILLAQLSFTVTPLEHLSEVIISYRIFLHLVYLQRSIRFSRVKIWNSIPCKFKTLFLKKFISE